ncbi:MAG: CoA transferase subunit A, partial [SAR202 cluster bacterium]|nr:CoA transferase subunit A [SAR202 cluster bacterium]
MPWSKVSASARDAVADVTDGASIAVSSFAGPGGMPHFLLLALWEQGAKDLTLIGNTGGVTMISGLGSPGGRRFIDHSILVQSGRVKKVIASYPVHPRPSVTTALEQALRDGSAEVELTPMGTLVERMRAAGAGIPAFYTPTGVGTEVERGKEKRSFDGREYLLERALRPDYAFVRAWKADTMGNIVYRKSSRAFGPVMVAAARVAIVEVDEVVEPGALAPE